MRIPSGWDDDGARPRLSPPVIDIIFLLGILALVALVALVGKGVEKL